MIKFSQWKIATVDLTNANKWPYSFWQYFVYSPMIKIHGSESRGQGGSTLWQARDTHMSIVHEQIFVKIKNDISSP